MPLIEGAWRTQAACVLDSLIESNPAGAKVKLSQFSTSTS
jgi:hypothetical protein